MGLVCGFVPPGGESFRVSRHDSLNGSTLSQGCCPVSSMKGEECVDVWTQSL